MNSTRCCLQSVHAQAARVLTHRVFVSLRCTDVYLCLRAGNDPKSLAASEVSLSTHLLLLSGALVTCLSTCLHDFLCLHAILMHLLCFFCFLSFSTLIPWHPNSPVRCQTALLQISVALYAFFPFDTAAMVAKLSPVL